MAAPTADDLGMLVGRDVDTDRGEFILTHLGNLAQAYVTPMTDAAWSVVLLAAVRLYTNASGATQTTLGPESAGFTVAGVNFTKAERAQLRMLGGQGGAFTIDPTPEDAGYELPWYLEPEGDWDDLGGDWP